MPQHRTVARGTTAAPATTGSAATSSPPSGRGDTTATTRAAFDEPVIRGCTCFRVRRLARRVTQIYDRVLAPSGLRVTQFSLLAVVIRADAMPIGAIAVALDMDRTTLTRNLKPLVDAGLLSLVRSSIDARQREARVTAEGRARHAEARRLWRRAQDELQRILGAPQVASLHRLFDGLIDTLDENQRPAPKPASPAARP